MKTELTLKLKLGEKRAVELTKDEAREVFETLKEIFEPAPRGPVSKDVFDTLQ